SPDFNPLDFYFWGHLKSIVYSTLVNNVDDLREKIRNGFEIIQRIPGIFERVRNSMLRYAVSDYYLFRSLQNSPVYKNHLSQVFFTEKPQKFYTDGIMALLEKWQKVIDQNGTYLV
ncbi:hypothetical protein ALC56_00109, partial [Trachymyrmex septentrionalis]